MKFYDGFGDKLILNEDENPNVVEITITEDAPDGGVGKEASFVLDKGQLLKIANFIIKKFDL
ncbi:hypothetical protein [Clostridium sp.]|uniref:hypothetical protein n=1 Tax=Clostridium sp. TaxID=1506 RepID=UPI001A40C0C9|nr:hypothetical protein [Clostridium sp.]MBK5239787.1 hypothetical protein [Clostridium sp.]